MPRGGVNIVLKEVEALRPGKEPKAKGMPTMEAQNVKRVTTYLGKQEFGFHSSYRRVESHMVRFSGVTLTEVRLGPQCTGLCPETIHT